MFKNKAELVEFVKHQLNIELEDDTNDTLNQKRNILYTQFPGPMYSGQVMRLLNKYNVRYEKHLNYYYWVWVK